MGLSGFLDIWLTRDTIFGVPIYGFVSFRTTKIVRVQGRTGGYKGTSLIRTPPPPLGPP